MRVAPAIMMLVVAISALPLGPSLGAWERKGRHDKYIYPANLPETFLPGMWMLKLFYTDGYDHWESGYTPKDCIHLPGPPREIYKLWHTNSPWVDGFRLYRDKNCKDVIPVKKYIFAGQMVLHHWKLWKVWDTVGSMRIDQQS